MRDFLAAFGVCFHRWSRWRSAGPGWQVRGCAYCHATQQRAAPGAERGQG